MVGDLSCRCLACRPVASSSSSLTAQSPSSALRVLAGVLSGPRAPGTKRRNAIRNSWMRYPGVGEELLVCFALGERGLTKRERKSFDANDVLWLDVEEPRMLTMSKVFAWWRAASSAIHWLTHAVKVDDDTYGPRNESVTASPPPHHTPFTEAYSHARRCARACERVRSARAQSAPRSRAGLRRHAAPVLCAAGPRGLQPEHVPHVRLVVAGLGTALEGAGLRGARHGAALSVPARRLSVALSTFGPGEYR